MIGGGIGLLPPLIGTRRVRSFATLAILRTSHRATIPLTVHKLDAADFPTTDLPMTPIAPALDAELAALRGAAQIELAQMSEDLGLDLAPPDPAGLSDVALNTAREIDKMRAEVADWALTSGRALACRRARALVRQLAEEVLAELDLCALGVG